MNDSKAAGIFDEAKGKMKQAVGETFNDQSMANEGAADEIKGHAEQTWGNVKDTAHDLSHQHSTTTPAHDEHATGHDVRSGITHAAENLKNSINRGLDHLKKD
jgi:uncharacterized protein YjbJ (UPF0337 family)